MSDKFVLNNVRLAFASVFQRAVFSGVAGKYEATLLLDKEEQADQIRTIRREIDEALLAKFGNESKVPKAIRNEKNCALRDGDNVDYDGFAGCMSFKCSNKVQPKLLDRQKNDIDADSGLLYSGCYADASVGIWIQDNEYGRKVNANLFALRFREHGEPFGGGGVPKNVEDDFDDLEESDANWDDDL